MSSDVNTGDPHRDPRLRVADFILANIEPILSQWEVFARGVWPTRGSIDPAELRDHAEAILRATVADMNSDQTAAEQAAKSREQGPGSPQGHRLDAASEKHGADRLQSGFNLAEVLAEYRALRASVIRLWRQTLRSTDVADLDDLTRFHESMDQSLTTAVYSFTDRVDDARRLFLAILGHDLRNPLNAIAMSAELLRAADVAPGDTAEAADQISASTTAMSEMITDLLDFTAAGLGGGMPLSRAATDLNALCDEVVGETRAAHPDCALSYSHAGDATGHWDAARLRQVISNLLGNAVQHGDGGAGCRVEVRLRGEASQVVLSVHNGGSPIPASMLPLIFDPLHRSAASMPRRSRPGSIGLGLYIAKQVVTAHGGTIAVTSSADAGTTFTVCLPRGPR